MFAGLQISGTVCCRGAFLLECHMEHHNDHDELTEEEASGGVKQQGVRIVLVVSLVLTIVVLSLAWMGMSLYGTPDP
jgi:hypothetical protein